MPLCNCTIQDFECDQGCIGGGIVIYKGALSLFTYLLSKSFNGDLFKKSSAELARSLAVSCIM